MSRRLPRTPAFAFAALGLCALIQPLSAQPVVLEDGSSVDGNFTVDENLTVDGAITQNGFGNNFFDAFISSFDGSLCIGNGCTTSESNGLGNPPLKIKWSVPDIIFEDTSTTSTVSTHDWRIRLNDAGIDRFSIQDEGDDWQTGSPTIPFSIAAGAPADSFWLASDGNIGLGTSIPQADLHLVGSSTATLRMQSTGSDAHDWEMLSNNLNWFLSNETDGRIPFVVRAGAGNASLFITDNDDIGMGTNAPEAPLHVQRDDATTDALQGILVENDSATNGPRGLLQLRNNGQVYFGLEDTSIPAGPNSGRAWNFQNLGGTFRVTTAPGGAGEVEMVLDVDGNMTIEGNYFASSGTQLNVPDYVFDADYDLKPLSEVAAFIDTHSHLPGVPSATEINAQGVNMTQMQMIHLKKIEELTLYTLEQEARVDMLEAANATLLAEMAALRTLVTRVLHSD